MKYLSKDGDEKFPGAVQASVKFVLEGNNLTIKHEVQLIKEDTKTVV